MQYSISQVTTRQLLASMRLLPTDSATAAIFSASIATDTSDASHTPNDSNAFTIQEMQIQLNNDFINTTNDDTDDDSWIYNSINAVTATMDADASYYSSTFRVQAPASCLD
ncbi:uncharacterized protein BX664DRAFT_353921 [Halteromyces radiatus]|uniref:uncharacterized protein n=1 Tax=Halteromyces radiatus TaxID=101107 RepID=UPI00221F5DA4|nr:uncharacterized protein BX664DRAFT_353921 [Halteromyces radiatus]KAI8076336.1 hypothetical protein BX664DRAFT_353921 [Halteromyces radiatus]